MITQSLPMPCSKPPSESTQTTDHILLQAVLESWVDGVLVLTDQGKWVQANAVARRICDRFAPERGRYGFVPEAIWRVCTALIQSRGVYPQQPSVFESEITVDATVLRVRVRWLNAEEVARPYLLVILEDRYQSSDNLARVEAARYNLTPREAKVWSLRRLGYKYEQIAAELYITIDTVKKHMKNIRAKQQLSLYMEECCSD